MELSDETMRCMLKEVSRNISAERRKRGLSMAQLAAMANLSTSHICKLEKSQCDVGLKALLRISAAFGLEAESLLPDEPWIERREEGALTRGEQFEQIVEDADPWIVELILRMACYIRQNIECNVS